jgi:hypothetical protein
MADKELVDHRLAIPHSSSEEAYSQSESVAEGVVYSPCVLPSSEAVDPSVEVLDRKMEILPRV